MPTSAHNKHNQEQSSHSRFLFVLGCKLYMKKLPFTSGVIGSCQSFQKMQNLLWLADCLKATSSQEIGVEVHLPSGTITRTPQLDMPIGEYIRTLQKGWMSPVSAVLIPRSSSCIVHVTKRSTMITPLAHVLMQGEMFTRVRHL